MATVQVNVRAAVENANLIRSVASRLRTDPTFKTVLEDLLGADSGLDVQTQQTVTSLLADMERRLKALEERVDRSSLVGASMAPSVDSEAPSSAVEGARGVQVRKRQAWTDADNEALQAIAQRGGTQVDAVHELGRSDSVISVKWNALGLPVPPRKGRKLKPRQG